MRRSILPLSMLVCAAAVLGAQTPSAYSYDFRARGDHDMDGITGTVRVRGGRERTYTTFNSDDFAHIASLGIRAAGKAVTMKLRDSNFETERLGAGEKIAGRATQHVRVTEHWTMDVGAMGFTTSDSVRHSLVRGTPLRTIITEREDNGRESRTVLEVTKIGTQRVEEAELKVPAGYTRKDGGLGRFKVKL
jgi:hypothetical protein